MSIRNLVENKTKLDYQAITTSLISEFGINDPINWDAVIPANVQHNLFGGETLRLFQDHPNFLTQKDIRTITLKKGQTSQLLILFAKLKDEKLSKSNIEKITKKFIGGSAAERYVVWFVGNPSNTEFKVVLSGKEGRKIVLKTLPFGINQPYYKTYDFILEEVHKKVSKFFVEPNELWQALWKSFDISVVNKKFYLDIKSAFDSLINDNVFKGSIRIEEARKQFAVRLIGRIIFSWFLKKKDIISEDVLSSNAISKYENYYLEFLEKLFFEVFNTPQKERGKLPDEIKDYPFLNGGLFEAQEGDYGDYKGKVFINNEWFISLFKDTLEKYNFTIDENTSSSSEIAIDPEMLGRIFENLLAEQNPETKESARKSTGSYYTPREIVDYMVEQSISEYLKSNIAQDVIANEVKQSITQSHSELVSESISQSIENFVHTEEFPEQLQPYSTQIIEKLNSVKVLDPACGSGAFPIGILQKLIALKLQLSPLTKGGNTKGVYDLKLQTILNSIYGCDIQPMAVELSRLRCWLSLIIDEDVDKKKSNWGIANLPNLDFKFVCVNTLIGLPPMIADSLGTSADDFNKLKKLREEFFTSSTKRKLQIEKEFKNLQNDIAEKQREWSTKNTAAVTMLINWNPFKVEKTDWFDPFWMFGINSGFDLIIGNPPYLESRSPNFSSNLKDKLQQAVNYRWAEDSHFITRGADLLIYFFERSISIINQRGWIVLITQNAWLDTDYGKSFQEFLLKHTYVKSVIDSEFKHFDSSEGPNINTVITLFNGNIPNNSENILFVKYPMLSISSSDKSNVTNYFNISPLIKNYAITDSILSQYKWGILLKSENIILELLERLNKIGLRLDQLKDYSLYIGQGLNLTKEHLVDKKIIESENIIKSIAIPIFTSDDGAPFINHSTNKYLIPKSKSSEQISNLLKELGLKLFNDESTTKHPPALILPRGIGRHFCAFNLANSYSSSFVDIYDDSITNTEEIRLNLWLFLNSSIGWLIREISGRKNLGGGMLKAEATDLKSFPIYYEFTQLKNIKNLFDSLNNIESYPPLTELNLEHHKLFDDIVFPFLGIDNSTRETIINILSDLISNRFSKSKT